MQAETSLLEGNEAAAAMLQRPAEEISAEGAWEHVRMVLEKLVRGHEGIISKLPSPSPRCYSLQVAGCFKAGEFYQVCSTCCKAAQSQNDDTGDSSMHETGCGKHFDTLVVVSYPHLCMQVAVLPDDLQLKHEQPCSLHDCQFTSMCVCWESQFSVC